MVINRLVGLLVCICFGFLSCVKDFVEADPIRNESLTKIAFLSDLKLEDKYAGHDCLVVLKNLSSGASYQFRIPIGFKSQVVVAEPGVYNYKLIQCIGIGSLHLNIKNGFSVVKGKVSFVGKLNLEIKRSKSYHYFNWIVKQDICGNDFDAVVSKVGSVNKDLLTSVFTTKRMTAKNICKSNKLYR